MQNSGLVVVSQHNSMCTRRSQKFWGHLGPPLKMGRG